MLIDFLSELHYFLEDFGFSVLIEIRNVHFRNVLIQLIPQCIEFCEPLRMITLGDFAFAALAQRHEVLSIVAHRVLAVENGIFVALIDRLLLFERSGCFALEGTIVFGKVTLRFHQFDGRGTSVFVIDRRVQFQI